MFLEQTCLAMSCQTLRLAFSSFVTCKRKTYDMWENHYKNTVNAVIHYLFVPTTSDSAPIAGACSVSSIRAGLVTISAGRLCTPTPPYAARARRCSPLGSAAAPAPAPAAAAAASGGCTRQACPGPARKNRFWGADVRLLFLLPWPTDCS